MNIQQVICFEEVCNCGSISKAAENLHLTASGVRLSLHRLEDELGADLIVWGARNFELTAGGRFFLEKAREMHGIYDSCIRYFEENTEAETVEIASGTTFPAGATGSLMREFIRHFPGVKCVCSDYPKRRSEKAVASRLVDFGLDIGPINEAEFEAMPVFSFSLALVLHKDSPLAGLAEVPLERLRGCALAADEVIADDADFARLCRGCGFEPEFAVRSIRDSVIFRMVSQNPVYVGICNVRTAEEMNFPNIVIRPLAEDGMRKTVYLFHKKNVELSRSASMVKRFMREKTKNGILDADTLE